MALLCDRQGCSQPRTNHSATAPHPVNQPSPGGPCAAYVPKWPCGNCGTDCELHDRTAPHPRVEVNCAACAAPAGFTGGGGGYGGGGATGGW